MITPDFSGKPTYAVTDAVTELLRVHARHLIATALEVEVTEMVNELKSAGRDVVRNGYLPERSVTTVVGDIEVEVPRIRARDGEPINFASKLIPPYLRRSKSIDAWVAYAYLKGISEGDMARVLEVVLGEGAKKLTPNVVSSLKAKWRTEFDEWKKQDLNKFTFSYIYVDGIYQKIRGDNPKLCVLVVIGVDDQGKKHLLTLEDGTRESTQSWHEVLVDLKSRGMNEPALAIGDGALGFWSALSEIYPTTKHQRCWLHKTGNVLNYLPKSLHSKVKGSIREIWMSPTRDDAKAAIRTFETKYGAKYPKAVNCLTKDTDALLAFYDFPAEHWVHLRTTNPIPVNRLWGLVFVRVARGIYICGRSRSILKVNTAKGGGPRWISQSLGSVEDQVHPDLLELRGEGLRLGGCGASDGFVSSDRNLDRCRCSECVPGPPRRPCVLTGNGQGLRI